MAFTHLAGHERWAHALTLTNFLFRHMKPTGESSIWSAKKIKQRHRFCFWGRNLMNVKVHRAAFTATWWIAASWKPVSLRHWPLACIVTGISLLCAPPGFIFNNFPPHQLSSCSLHLWRGVAFPPAPFVHSPDVTSQSGKINRFDQIPCGCSVFHFSL